MFVYHPLHIGILYSIFFGLSFPFPTPDLVPRQSWNNTGSTNDVDHHHFLKSKRPFCGNYSEPTIFSDGDYDDGGAGVVMRDMDYTNRRQGHYYFFYENNRDDHPWKYTLLKPGADIFISVCPTFAGRIVRGNPSFNLDGTIRHNLGTWIELSWEGPPSKRSWGDISLLEGCDGAALLTPPTDRSGVFTGFSTEILTGAPYTALTSKLDGSVALAKTVGDDANFDTTQYELGLLDPTTQAFIVQSYKPVVVSTNGRWDLTLYPGTY